MTAGNIQGAPDLVVEVLSESTAQTNRTVKLKLYSRFGVKEYWMIDPIAVTAEIYGDQDAGLDLVHRLAAKDGLTSPLFPGLVLRLDQLYART